MPIRMSFHGLLFTAALAFAGAGTALAQSPAPSNPNPTAGAIAVARELLALKGGVEMFNGMVAGVIENAKNTYVPTNPQLGKPLNDVAAQLRTEYEPKKSEVFTEVARAYATRFTESEMKELLAFYRTNLGKKVLTEEPVAVEEAFRKAQDWSNTFSEQVLARFRVEMKKKGYDL